MLFFFMMDLQRPQVEHALGTLAGEEDSVKDPSEFLTIVKQGSVSPTKKRRGVIGGR
jgi:hypothetical protein